MYERKTDESTVLLPGEVERRRFTAEEYHRMGEVGILHEDDRVELIEGEIVEMTPIGPRHLSCVIALNRLLVSAVGEENAMVSPQNPVRLGERLEPQPDISLLKAKEEGYFERLPGPEDVLVAIEVADTSLSYDRNVKLPLYARAGIPEVWVVDLGGSRLEVYTQPAGGRYESVRSFGREETLRSASVPGLELPVGDLLPA